MEYVLTTQNLTKNYRQSRALNNLSINVPRGAIYGLVGRNGSGKTTLIRVICGLQTPTEGSYTLFGVNCNHESITETRQRMGAVVETPSIYLNMTAEDNLREQCIIVGLPSFGDIPDLLRLVGLEHVGEKKARDFSLGMKQRLGIAIALVSNPDFLVLDEPINGLDPQGILEIREIILKLNHERQITVLISSHFLGELSKLATHYGFLDNGSLVEEIDSHELDRQCKKYLTVKVSNTKALACALEELRLPYEILSDTEANIFEASNLSEIAARLTTYNCQLITALEREESLETYFINLVGGAHRE